MQFTVHNCTIIPGGGGKLRFDLDEGVMLKPRNPTHYYKGAFGDIFLKKDPLYTVHVHCTLKDVYATMGHWHDIYPV